MELLKSFKELVACGYCGTLFIFCWHRMKKYTILSCVCIYSDRHFFGFFSLLLFVDCCCFCYCYRPNCQYQHYSCAQCTVIFSILLLLFVHFEWWFARQYNKNVDHLKWKKLFYEWTIHIHTHSEDFFVLHFLFVWATVDFCDIWSHW